MGNTVGNSNANFCKFGTNPAHAYVLGLWCADGYHRTSSIGLSNIDKGLIGKFKAFLLNYFDVSKLRLKVYTNDSITESFTNFGINEVSILPSRKARHIAYHVYVNSRQLLREFIHAKKSQKVFTNVRSAWAYIAGRFDGDGTIGKDLRRDLRISYTTQAEADEDRQLLFSLGIPAKVYRYVTSVTYVVYIPRDFSSLFIKNCLTYSHRLQKLAFESRRDLVQFRA